MFVVMNRDNSTKIRDAWSAILQTGAVESYHLRPADQENNVSLIGITHFTRHEEYWESLLFGLGQSDFGNRDLSVLITAASVGAEVYDAARIAKTLGLNNLHFYGHDMSHKFTERAYEGIYPLGAAMVVPNKEHWFELDTPYEGYARIRKDRFDNVTFLEPSDIRDLKGSFDIVSENIMNPCPPDIEAMIIARARHLAVTSKEIVGISNAFENMTNLGGVLSIPDSVVRLCGKTLDETPLNPFQPSKNPDVLPARVL